MLASIPSSDITLLAIVVLSCTVVVLGALLCKRFHLAFFKRLLQMKVSPFQTSTSTSILPSFGASKISPYDSLGQSAVTDMHDSRLNLLPDSPYCITPPSASGCSPDLPQPPSVDVSRFLSAMSPPTPATPWVDAIIANTDILPPNITIPTPRQTPLDRMMDRWRRDAGNGRTRGFQTARNHIYAQTSQASVESSDTPSIIVTLPSSQAVSPTKAYASPTSPDDDPFFWDTFPRPHENNTVRGTQPCQQPKCSEYIEKRNPIGLGLIFPPSRQRVTHVFEHLAVPSNAGKHKNRSRRTPLGELTNPPSDSKHTAIAA